MAENIENTPSPEPNRRLIERDQHMESRWRLYEHTAQLMLELYDSGMNKEEVAKRIAALNMFLETKASLDSTTALYNGAYFKENVLEPSILRMKSDPKKTSYLGYVDVDNLGLANGLVGHAGGDKLLEAVTMALQASTLELSDMKVTLGHLSGDEFCFLVDNNDRLKAMEFSLMFLKKLKTILNTSPLFVEGDLRNLPKNTSASIGIRAINGESDGEKALHEADTAMFLAKQLGKGQTIFYEDMSEDDKTLARTVSKKYSNS